MLVLILRKPLLHTIMKLISFAVITIQFIKKQIDWMSSTSRFFVVNNIVKSFDLLNSGNNRSRA